MIRPMNPELLAQLELVAQAVVQLPPRSLESDLEMRAGTDDLAPFRAAPLMLDDQPFALFRYDTAPAGEDEIQLPETVSLDRVPRLIERILAELGIPLTAVKWQRESLETPF